jgi:hypothetical protein
VVVVVVVIVIVIVVVVVVVVVVVSGRQVVPTDEMAALGHEPFSPFVVEQNAATLLKFLKDNCNQNFGSYWLYRKQGEAVVQLFDLSTFPIDQKCRSKWTYMMAMLCYRCVCGVGPSHVHTCARATH